MTDAPSSPEQEIAGTLNDLTQQTRRLVHKEAQEAEHEVWEKAKMSAPVIGLFALSALLGLLAGASLYRFSMRILERMLPPSLAALLGATVYGAGAVGVLRLAVSRLDEVRAPVPSDTARQAATDVAEAVRGAS